MPADNERFCEMAGATRPKFCLTLQRQWLVRAAVKPATSQSRHPVIGNAAQSVVKRVPYRQRGATRQSSGIEYRTDNEVQPDKAVELSNAPTMKS
jgi:hypothetical protein